MKWGGREGEEGKEDEVGREGGGRGGTLRIVSGRR